ncbi:MAG: DMT family transporter [Salinarimonadaceae bacterium]|nr:MAG: DMT family transporter [Salinarimonadaceae bacterium]
MHGPAPSFDNRRGIIAMLCASALFVTNDTLVKLGSEFFPTTQIMAIRGLCAATLALIFVLMLGHGRALRSLGSPLVALRAILEAGCAFFFMSALPFLPLANIIAILQATPIIMTVMAIALGFERVGWRRWAAIITGFLGVLLIVQPELGAFDFYVLYALTAAVLVAVRDLVTARIKLEVPSIVIATSTTIGVCLAGFGIGFARGDAWQDLARPEAGYLLAAATLLVLGNLTVVMAFRNVEVAVVSPFRYAMVVVAIILGFAVFGDLPNALALTGIGLVVGAGIYTIHRENVVRRASAGLASADGRRES